MSIEIKISSILAPYTKNQQTAVVKGGTVGECLNDLAKQFPRLKGMLFDRHGKLNRNIDIHLNRASAKPDPMEKTVKDGDRLHITLLVGGG